MKTLLVDVENASNLSAFLKVMENLDFVKSVNVVALENNEDSPLSVNEPSGAYNWLNPNRPASEDEIDKLIDVMENSSGGYSTEDVRLKMKQWSAEKSK